MSKFGGGRAAVRLDGMLARRIADVGNVGMRSIGADVDNAAACGAALQLAGSVLRHQQGKGTAVDGKVCIDLGGAYQLHGKLRIRNQGRIKGF